MSNPMEIGAMLVASDEGRLGSLASSDREPKGEPIRLPGMETLLHPSQFNFNDLSTHWRVASPAAARGPPSTLEQQQRQRRQSAQPGSPHHSASSSPSPALSNASTAATEAQPPTPPAMAQQQHQLPSLAQQKPLPPASTPFTYPEYRPGYSYSQNQQQDAPLVQQQQQQQGASRALQSRPRANSAASRTTGGARARREHRPTYGVEEEFFIWYHRVDMGMDWQEIRMAYSRQFPNRVLRGHQGIQCKYYRFTEMHGIPKCRERNRTSASSKMYGVRNWKPDVWYPWMREPCPPGVVPAPSAADGR